MLFPPFRNLTKRLKSRTGTLLCRQVTRDEKSVLQWDVGGGGPGNTYNCNEGCTLLDELEYQLGAVV